MELFTYNSKEFKSYLQKNAHEQGEVKFLQSIAKEGITAVEVGAHIGITAVAIAKKIGEKGKLYCFEPVSEYFDILKKNVDSNRLNNVELFRLGVADKVGRRDFYKDGGASRITATKASGNVRIATTTLDIFLTQLGINKVDLLNMDCEGSELLVLRGAERILKNSQAGIFCEIHHSFLEDLGQSAYDIVAYLKRLGFYINSVGLDDLSLGESFQECQYIYARKQDDNVK